MRQHRGSDQGTTGAISGRRAQTAKRVTDPSRPERKLHVQTNSRSRSRRLSRRLFNPAKRGVPNTQRRPKEKRPFESWAQIEAIAARLGPVYGPMVIFGAATGLRPSELFGLEQHDVDRELGVVYVRRAYANGRIKNTKTRLSTRAVPLQAKAVEALDRLPASVNPILFPNARGGRIDFRVFGHCHWRPAQIAAGVEPIRGLYDMRHTYATFALRAGVPVFAVSRVIGSSIAMIDRHYGHLARDSREHAVALLDALALERAVDAAWTSVGRRANALSISDSKRYRKPTHRRVDARWTPKLVLVAPSDNERSKRSGVEGTSALVANGSVWSGPRPRRSLTVIARRLSGCCCGSGSWSWRTSGSRRGWPSLSGG